jgi:hypothetical protein
MSPAKIWYCLLAAVGMVGPVFCTAQESALGSGPDGACFITFQAPGNTSTTPISINNANRVAGFIANANEPSRFVRDAGGAITSFDPPGSVATHPVGINGEGTITGEYTGGNGRTHGFVRDVQGAITSFDAPSATNTDTIPTFINAAGTVIGFTASPLFGLQLANHGFVRDPLGAFTLFDPEGSVSTSPTGINAAGIIVGNYDDDYGRNAAT